MMLLEKIYLDAKSYFPALNKWCDLLWSDAYSMMMWCDMAMRYDAIISCDMKLYPMVPCDITVAQSEDQIIFFGVFKKKAWAQTEFFVNFWWCDVTSCGMIWCDV